MPNLYDSLMERMEGREYSNYFSAFCPWDSHATPALLVFDDGMVKCLSCNKIWSHAQLDKKIGSHYSPKQRNDTVSKVLPQWRKWEEKYGDLEGIADAAHKTLKAHSVFQTYFKKRKIYEFVDMGSLGIIDSWATFPVRDRENKLVDIVVRNIGNKSITRYVVSPNQEVRHLYVPSWEKVLASQTIYVVYGIIDSISLHLAGLPSLTGITGKSLNAELLRPLNKRYVIIPDKDEEKEARMLVNDLGWRAKLKEIDWPEGTKDTDDIRRKFGNEYLLHAIGA